MQDRVFSRRSTFEEPDDPLSAALDEARARPDTADLTLTNPTRADLPYDGQAIAEALHAASGAPYTPHPLGLPRAREALGEALGLDPARLMLTASTSEAYAILLRLLCDPGGAVAVPRPSYPLLDVLARLEGVNVVPYRLRYDGEWFIDAQSLAAAAAVSDAVVAVAPSNPTGWTPSPAEGDQLLALGRPLIVDRVFAPYPVEPKPDEVDFRACARGLCFTLDGLSKRAGLPQMKLGWTHVTGEGALVEGALARLEHLNDALLSASGPAQHAAAALLAASAPTRAAIQRRIARHLGVLREALAGSAADVLRVEGGWQAMVRVPAVQTETQWVLDLIARGVATQPGWFYDVPDGAHLVLSLLPAPDTFARGVERLARAGLRAQLARRAR